MSLIKCAECNGQVSDRAAACPHCGAPVSAPLVCSECQSALPRGSITCRECGAPVAAPHPVQLAQPATSISRSTGASAPPASLSEPIVLYPSPSKGVLLLLGSVALVAASLLLRANLDSTILRHLPSNIAHLLVIGSIAFFSFAGISGFYRLLVPKPSIVLDGDGITATASALGETKIAWDEISDVKIFTLHGQRMLEIIPKDLPTLLSRVGALSATAIKANAALGYPPIFIHPAWVRCSLEQLESLIRERLAAGR